MKKTTIAIFAATFAVLAGAQSLEEINAQLTKIGAEQIELRSATRDLSEKMQEKMNSRKFDTEEIKALREKVDELRAQYRDARAELAKQLAELPEFKDDHAVVTNNIAKMDALALQRQKLIQMRNALQGKPSQPAVMPRPVGAKAAPEAPPAEAKPAADPAAK